jgi:hypothetical protein
VDLGVDEGVVKEEADGGRLRVPAAHDDEEAPGAGVVVAEAGGVLQRGGDGVEEVLLPRVAGVLEPPAGGAGVDDDPVEVALSPVRLWGSATRSYSPKSALMTAATTILCGTYGAVPSGGDAWVVGLRPARSPPPAVEGGVWRRLAGLASAGA